MIVETESYEARRSRLPRLRRADRAQRGRSSARPDVAYVYFSYGVHSLLNAVAEPEGSAAAVLIRALEPRCGLDAMRARRGRERASELCSGPGKLTQALGVGLAANGASLLNAPRSSCGPRKDGWEAVEVATGPRIGISRATELPWRFCAAGSRYLSRPLPRRPR